MPCFGGRLGGMKYTHSLSLGLIVLAAASTLFAEDLLTHQHADGEIAGWTSFHEEAGTKTGDVWTLCDDGTLICKGTPRGYLYTKQSYQDVTLSFQWRWPPAGKPGKGGVLLRKVGDDKIWPRSLEVQLNADNAGDFWGINGYDLAADAERTERITHEKFGKLVHVTKLEAVEKPAGEWNTGKVTLKDGNVTVWMNGKLVNRGTNCDLTPGPILLTAEGNEIQFRNLQLTSSTAENVKGN